KLECSRQKNRIEIGSVELVYKQLQKLARHPGFSSTFARLEKDAHPAAQFLKVLSIKFRSADMSDLLIDHAREKLGDIQPDQDGKYSIGKTGEALRGFRKT